MLTRLASTLFVTAVLTGCFTSRGAGEGSGDGGVRIDGRTVDRDASGAPVPDGGGDMVRDGGEGLPSDGGGIAPECSAGETPTHCPTDAPDRHRMCGACCYRASNAGRPDAPELRLSGLRTRSPTSLANAVVRGLLASALDAERFNWAFRIAISGSTATVETGYGARNPDATFSFVSGAAPGPGDASRWDPVTLEGTFAGGDLGTESADLTVTLPIFAEDGTVMMELPLTDLSLAPLTLTHQRTCVGERLASSYSTDAGRIGAYITVADAKGVPVVVGETLDTTLCMFVAGMSSETGTCDGTAQADWPVPPDSTCDGGRCRLGGCTASTCNAWQVMAEVAAHGVEITD